MFPTLVLEDRARGGGERGDRRSRARRDRARVQGRPAACARGLGGSRTSHSTNSTTAQEVLVSCVHRVVPGILRFLGSDTTRSKSLPAGRPSSARGAAHKMHQHPNNFLSGVYYIRTRPNTASTSMTRATTGSFDHRCWNLQPKIPTKSSSACQAGTLLIFPSYLQHSVDANRSDQERVSVSFNIMFSGFTERLSKPLW